MIEIPGAGPFWSDEVLAARQRLPLTPDVGETRTERLIVRPYARDDADELFAISNGDAVTRMGRAVDGYDADRMVWRFMHAGPFADPAGLHRLHGVYLEKPDTQPYTVTDAATGELVGSVTLLANVPATSGSRSGTSGTPRRSRASASTAR